MTQPGTVEPRAPGLRYPGSGTRGTRTRVGQGASRRNAGEIGSTGAGKSTLVALVARLMDATEGDVLVGGVDVRELAPEVLWRWVGYVPQRSFLFAGTVRRTWRSPADATDQQLWDALGDRPGVEFRAGAP